MKKYVRCFDCGELKEAYEIIVSNIVLCRCNCKECGSITTSSNIDHIEDLDS